MANITVTRRFAELLMRLQGGGRVIEYRWRRGRRYPSEYYVTDDTTGYNTTEDPEVTETWVKKLLKAKLIQLQDPGENLFSRYYVKKIWKLTPAGQNFRLPPQEFWVEYDDPADIPS